MPVPTSDLKVNQLKQTPKKEVLQAMNHDLVNISTPIDVVELETLLNKTNYNPKETAYLIKGFTKGFSLGYKGPKERKDTASNIPFTPGIGDKVHMWNKIIKEVQLGCFAGPYEKIPFENYVQSPIGLVPKAGG